MKNSEELENSCNGNTDIKDDLATEINGVTDCSPLANGVANTNGNLQNSYYCMGTLLVTTASTMMSIGLAVGALNPTLIIMSSFYNETHLDRYGSPMPKDTLTLLLALTVSILLAGGFFGSLSLGIFAKFFTRKQSMVVINVINIFAVGFVSLAGYLIPSYEAILIGRFFMGFVSGIGMNVIPIVISETSTKEKSAFYLSIIGVYLSFGGLIGLILGYKKFMGNDHLWPILLAVPALPSLLYVLVSPWLPETPSYLVLIGEKKKAFRTLKKLRIASDDSLIHQELEDIRKGQETKASSKQAVSLKTMFRKSGYRWQLFLVVMVFLESQFCGINGMGMYTDIIFKKAGIEADHTTFASMIVYTVQFLVALAGSKAVDMWGPRRLSIFWSIMMSFSLTLLTISMFINGMAYISVVAVALYVLSWACGPNITLFPLVAALTTEPTREASFKFGGGLFWIASWFNGFITPYLLENIPMYAFVPWALCNFFFTIFFYFKIPETRGKTSEELQIEIHGQVKRKKKKNSDSSTLPLNPVDTSGV